MIYLAITVGIHGEKYGAAVINFIYQGRPGELESIRLTNGAEIIAPIAGVAFKSGGNPGFAGCPGTRGVHRSLHKIGDAGGGWYWQTCIIRRGIVLGVVGRAG